MAKKRKKLPAKLAREKAAAAGDRQREQKRAWANRAQKEARDVGDIPPCGNPELRESCRLDLERFCLQYFPSRFYLPLSEDHRKIVRKVQEIVLGGGLYIEAMPRGSGKTTILTVAEIWAAFYAHQEFPVLVEANHALAADAIGSIKREIDCNELLARDFPEIVIPLQKLEGTNKMAAGQHHHGQRTYVELSRDRIVLPTIEGSKASGVVIVCKSLLSATRGLQFTRPDGKVARPSLYILNDPQTDESAASPEQCDKREKVITRMLGGGGPGRKAGAVAAVTVIAKNDLAERLLDRSRNPAWQGDICRMVYSWPTNTQTWAEYAEIRKARQLKDAENPEKRRISGEIPEETAWYQARREAMDAGSRVGWEHRFDAESGEISAIQHAFNLKIDLGEEVFQSEYQNDPLDPARDGSDDRLDKGVGDKLTRVPRGVVPMDCSTLVAFFDVGSLTDVHWLVLALGDGFLASVVDYGRQGVAKGPESEEARIRASVDQATASVLGRSWVQQDSGEVIPIKWAGVDSGYKRDTVEAAIRESPFRDVLLLTRGIPVAPGTDWHIEKAPGARNGDGWRCRRLKGGVLYFHYWANKWKTFAFERLRTPMGGAGRAALPGESPRSNQELCDHLLSEYRIKVEAKGMVCDTWHLLPNHQNHWWDCFVGGCALGSWAGLSLKAAATAGRARQVRRAEGSWFSQGRERRHGK